LEEHTASSGVNIIRDIFELSGLKINVKLDGSKSALLPLDLIKPEVLAISQYSQVVKDASTNCRIPLVTEYKYLGCYINSCLSP
jgi:hypothetical protein